MTNDKEIYRNIKGVPGYQVSNWGNVRSLDRIIITKLGKLLMVKGKSLKLSKTTGGYAQIVLGGYGPTANRFAVHRLVAIVFMGLNRRSKLDVDHIDRNRMNNHVRNLRICSRRQNCGNQKIRSTNTSGFKGVSWHKQRQKWYARICLDNRLIGLGMYKTAKEAAIAYDKAALRIYGDFASPNKNNLDSIAQSFSILKKHETKTA
jgi:hypothetical protein